MGSARSPRLHSGAFLKTMRIKKRGVRVGDAERKEAWMGRILRVARRHANVVSHFLRRQLRCSARPPVRSSFLRSFAAISSLARPQPDRCVLFRGQQQQVEADRTEAESGHQQGCCLAVLHPAVGRSVGSGNGDDAIAAVSDTYSPVRTYIRLARVAISVHAAVVVRPALSSRSDQIVRRRCMRPTYVYYWLPRPQPTDQTTILAAHDIVTFGSRVGGALRRHLTHPIRIVTHSLARGLASLGVFHHEAV